MSDTAKAHNTTAVRVKICGITRVVDAVAASAAGADAIGLVFFPRSPRFVDPGLAREIALQVGPFVTVVGLFVDADRHQVEAVLRQVPLHLLQFHGAESEAECTAFGRPYLKALRMRPGLDVMAAVNTYPTASGLLLDAYKKGTPGGTGESFDWQRVPRGSGRPLVLAGGLTPANVAAAVQATRVYGVDVSGGVESAPGIKDPEKMRAFIRHARTQV